MTAPAFADFLIGNDADDDGSWDGALFRYALVLELGYRQ